MQHRYFGDVGDFGKYGLLRTLCGINEGPRLRLGVIWYLFPNESHNDDGKHVGYLKRVDASFRNCDELLYDKLRSLLFDGLTFIPGNRHLGIAESSSILPPGTMFYSTPLTYERRLSVAARIALRNEWFKNALSATAAADLIFMDPDNGIECASVRRTSAKGPKYAYWSDIDAIVERGQSVLIYHHLNRSKPHREQITEKVASIRQRYREEIKVCVLTFKRGTSRAYFLIAAGEQSDLLVQRMSGISGSDWGRHFSTQSDAFERRS
jgi:hypothetical protein